MWELDYKESWAPKNWCFWTVVLEKTLVNPLDNKQIQPVYPKSNQSWIVIGRTDAEAETPVLWSPDPRSWLIGKDPDAGKGWRQEEKGTTEDKMVGWHHHSMNISLSISNRWWRTGKPSMLSHGVAKTWAQLSSWKTTKETIKKMKSNAPNGRK